MSAKFHRDRAYRQRSSGYWERLVEFDNMKWRHGGSPMCVRLIRRASDGRLVRVERGYAAR